MAKYRTPRYEHADAIKDYEELARHYDRLAADDLAFNAARRRERKPVVKAVANSARKHKARAKNARAAAERLRARTRSS